MCTGSHQQQLQESKRRVRRLEAQEAVAQGKLAKQQEALEAQKQQLKDLQVTVCIWVPGYISNLKPQVCLCCNWLLPQSPKAKP